MEFNPRPTPNDPERPWIGDLPGQGSQGPSDLPQKETCPHCGQPHKGGVRKDNPVTEQTVLSGYRGQQQGRGGHFGSGHQKEDQWGRPDKSPPPTKWSGQPGINSPNPHHPLDMHPNHPDYHDQTFEEKKKYGGDINNNPNFIMVTGDRSHIRKTPHDPNAQPTY
jgi:hypothetical protein